MPRSLQLMLKKQNNNSNSNSSLKHGFLVEYVSALSFSLGLLTHIHAHTNARTHTHVEFCVSGLQGVHSGEESTVWQTWGRSQIWLVHMVCGHAAWLCLFVCVCVCVCSAAANGSLHLNIYEGQWLPRGESCVVFTGRMPSGWMKTTLHYVYCHHALEQSTQTAIASAQREDQNLSALGICCKYMSECRAKTTILQHTTQSSVVGPSQNQKASWWWFFRCCSLEGPMFYPFSNLYLLSWTPVEQRCNINSPKYL